MAGKTLLEKGEVGSGADLVGLLIGVWEARGVACGETERGKPVGLLCFDSDVKLWAQHVGLRLREGFDELVSCCFVELTGSRASPLELSWSGTVISGLDRTLLTYLSLGILTSHSRTLLGFLEL